MPTSDAHATVTAPLAPAYYHFDSQVLYAGPLLVLHKLGLDIFICEPNPFRQPLQHSSHCTCYMAEEHLQQQVAERELVGTENLVCGQALRVAEGGSSGGMCVCRPSQSRAEGLSQWHVCAEGSSQWPVCAHLRIAASSSPFPTNSIKIPEKGNKEEVGTADTSNTQHKFSMGCTSSSHSTANCTT